MPFGNVVRGRSLASARNPGAVDVYTGAPTLLTAVTNLGLAPFLSYCFDAHGSQASAPSYEFLTFNGTTVLSLFGSQPPWANNIHKANATWSIVFGYYPVATAGTGIIGTEGNISAVGFQQDLAGTLKPRILVTASSAGDVLNVSGDTALTVNAWNFHGLSINGAAAGIGFWYLNGAYNQVSSANTFASAYTSPSASAAANVVEIGSDGNGQAPSPSGGRLMFGAVFSTNLSKGTMDALWSVMRVRLAL